MSPVSRRKFLKKSAALGALAAAGGAARDEQKRRPAAVQPARRGSNDTIRVGVAGIHGQGKGHIGAYLNMKNVEVAYLIDPDAGLFAERGKQVEDKLGRRPKCVQDVRKALDDRNLDAISIATPNHWHSLMTIWACQAGKDVYVEKPMSHNLHEGRVVVQAARRYKRIVQHGTQNRSNQGWAKVIAAIKSGKLGKLLVARGLCYKSGGGRSTRGDIGFAPHKPPPPELDFNLWLGPAPDQPYHENLVHYRWHWFWDFGNGDLGNQGVHQMDVARWGIDGATLPRSVISFGGRLGYLDQAEAASTEVAVMDFGDAQLIFETRGLKSNSYQGVGIGNVFHLEAGTIIEHKFFPKDSKEPAPLPEVEYHLGPGSGPFGNFIAAVRSRKPSDLNAEALEGHYSSALCHLANISVRLGGKIPFQPRTRAFDDNQDAYDALVRTEQHLADNGVNLEQSGYTLGRRLMVDAGTERIVNDGEGNAMLTRYYREPFVVPDELA